METEPNTGGGVPEMRAEKPTVNALGWHQVTPILSWIDALLILYWVIYVGTGMSSWLSATAEEPVSPIMRAVHWSSLLLLMLRAAQGFFVDVRAGWKPTSYQIGIGLILLLTVVDGVARSGIMHVATVSSAMACLIILSMFFAFREENAKRMLAVSVAVICLAHVCLMAFELYHDRFMSLEYGRAASLFANPNVAGSALAILALAVVRWLPAPTRLLFLSVVGFGVVFTLSRSSMIAFGLGCAWLVGWQVYHRSFRDHFAKIYLAVAACLVGVAVIAGTFYGDNRYPFALLDSIDEISRLVSGSDLELAKKRVVTETDPSVGLGSLAPGVQPTDAETMYEENTEQLTLEAAGELNSGLSRILLLKRGLNSFLDHPFIGIGVGRSFELRTHNTALHVANSFGFLGLVGLTIFLFGYFSGKDEHGYRRAVGLALLVVVLFSHGVLMNNPLVLAVATSLVLIPGDTRHRYEGAS